MKKGNWSKKMGWTVQIFITSQKMFFSFNYFVEECPKFVNFNIFHQMLWHLKVYFNRYGKCSGIPLIMTFLLIIQLGPTNHPLS